MLWKIDHTNISVSSAFTISGSFCIRDDVVMASVRSVNTRESVGHASLQNTDLQQAQCLPRLVADASNTSTLTGQVRGRPAGQGSPKEDGHRKIFVGHMSKYYAVSDMKTTNLLQWLRGLRLSELQCSEPG